MKVAYLECATGISGDMTLAALLDSGVDLQTVQAGIASLNLPGVALHVSEVMQSCFRATRIRVEHPEQHAHRHYQDIVRILDQATDLTPSARSLAEEMFLAVAQAEARVHGTDVEKIHFHEVGAIDSIVDIVGVAIGFDYLGCDQIHCGAIPTGRGEVLIDHGLCPVPTPGTAELLKGVPLKDVPIDAELTTPTGAAIVKTVVDRFGALPAMTISSIGYGAGTLEFRSRANVLRLFVGEMAVETNTDEICLLETNLDDISGEVIGYTTEKLLAAGARDVFSTQVQMKKNRPGIVLSVMCDPTDRGKLEDILFSETGTLGVRRQTLLRSTLPRRAHTVMTEFGAVLGKVAWPKHRSPVFAPEFDACKQLAETTGNALREIYRAAISAFDHSQPDFASEKPLSTGQPADAVSDHHHHDHDSHSHDHDHHGHDSHSHDH